jgi:ribosomal protein L25 (general stress protein Ctc)
MSRIISAGRNLERLSFLSGRARVTRWLSQSTSAASSLRVDPSRLVDGATKHQLHDNPALEEYIRANFPDAFVENSEESEVNHVINYKRETGMPRSSEGLKTSLESEYTFPLNIRPLRTVLRDPTMEEGTRSCRRLRKEEGVIPGLIYGSDPNLGLFSYQPESKILVKTPSSVLQTELDRFGHHVESRVYDLTLYDESNNVLSVHRVVPRDLQRHPVHASVLYCVNFCRYHPGRPIEIPITYLNEEESPALKRDGFILPIKRFIECFVEDGAPIPEKLELECTGLRYKDVVRKDRIVLPDGVRFSDRVVKRGDELIIGVVFGKGRGLMDDTEAAAGA